MQARSMDLQSIDLTAVNTLVFEGCGGRFKIYSHALSLFKLNQIKEVAASSSGSIIAFYLGIGYTPDQINQLFDSLDYDKLMDPSLLCRVPMIGHGLSMMYHQGVDSGNKILALFKRHLREIKLPENLTFLELHELKELGDPFMDIYFTGANITRQGELQVFSYKHTPHVPIAQALVASIAYPGLIKPVPILINDKFEKFIDGGIRDNFPVGIFPKTQWDKILGLKVDTQGEIFGHAFKEANLSEFLYALVHDGEHDYKQHHQKRTIQFYDCDLGVFEIKHSPLQGLAMKTSGIRATKEYFKHSKETKIGDEKKSTLSLPHDNRGIQARTLRFIESLGVTPYSDLINDIEKWDKSENYIYYHIALEALRKQSSYFYNTKSYQELLQSLLSHALASAKSATASSNEISDVIVNLIRYNQMDKAINLLKELLQNPINADKLLNINRSEILGKMNQVKMCSSNAKYKSELIEIINTLESKKLAQHPGAIEAHYIIKIDKLLKSKNFSEAFNLLKNISSYVDDKLAKEIFATTYQQLSKHQSSESTPLVEFLEAQEKDSSKEPASPSLSL